MLREVMVKIGGATLMLLSIGSFALGLVMANKFLQATGFMGGIVAAILLFYARVKASARPPEEEPPEMRPASK